MPKLLVLFDGVDEVVVQVARWIHEGARSVRFAEADLMRLPGEAPVDLQRIRPFEDAEALAQYDAIALGAPAGGTSRLVQLMADAGPYGMRGALANKLGAVFPDATAPAATGDEHPGWPLLAPMARYGMILVPPGYAGPAGEPEGLEAASRRLGRRLIDIAAWITHARSHHSH